MRARPQVREKESNIDSLITPIEDMYALLLRYEVGAAGRAGGVQGMRFGRLMSN